jgi:periplasmic protein TonB
MKKLQTLLFLLVVSFSLSAQVDPDFLNPALPTEKPKKVQPIAEVMPEYEGGQAALMNFISKTMVYPQNAIDDEIQGKVYLGFVVSSTGALEDIRVIRGVPGGEELNREAIRVIKLTNGKWKPGSQGGVYVNVNYTLPIVFHLQ